MTIQHLDRKHSLAIGLTNGALTLSSQNGAFAHHAIFSSAAHRNGAQSSNK